MHRASISCCGCCACAIRQQIPGAIDVGGTAARCIASSGPAGGWRLAQYVPWHQAQMGRKRTRPAV
eukprot:11710322-Prorocentrum_lima.AAC.1